MAAPKHSLALSTEAEMMPFGSIMKVGSSKPTGSIRMIITTQPMGLASEDGMTEISGISGLTSDAGANRRRDEQDLRGETGYEEGLGMTGAYSMILYAIGSPAHS